MTDVSKKYKSGVIWTVFFSFFALGLGFARNYFLAENFDGSEVLGVYALVVLFINSINTFGLFGGASLLSTLIPKENSNSKQWGLVFKTIFISFLLSSVFFGGIYYSDDLLKFVFNDNLNREDFLNLTVLIPFVLLSQIAIFYLQGRLDFFKSSIFNQVQIYIVTIALFVAVLNDNVMRFVIENPFVFFIGLVILSQTFVIFKVFLKEKIPLTSIFDFEWLDKKYLQLGSNLHLNTIITFVYLFYDQLIINKYFGLKELGIYFLLLQLVDLIRFIPMKLGQVYLSSFSKVIKENRMADLNAMYSQTSQGLLFLTIGISLFLVTFSKLLFDFFNIDYIQYSLVFMVLIGIRNVASLGGINSMLILSKERSRAFLINNIVLVVIQLLLIHLFIEEYGLITVVGAQLISTIFGQIGLWIILKTDEHKVSIPLKYFLNLFLIIGLMTLTMLNYNIYLLTSAVVIAIIIFYLDFFKKQIKSL